MNFLLFISAWVHVLAETPAPVWLLGTILASFIGAIGAAVAVVARYKTDRRVADQNDVKQLQEENRSQRDEIDELRASYRELDGKYLQESRNKFELELQVLGLTDQVASLTAKVAALTARLNEREVES